MTTEKIVTEEMLQKFYLYLIEEEKSGATVRKYLRDIRYFSEYADGGSVNKQLILAYKISLAEKYTLSSANSMLAALNVFLRFAGWQECCVKQFKIQKKIYTPEEEELTKEEYIRLIDTANKNGNQRLALILQTICGTGIRVSELPYITVEAVRKGEAVVSCKGKIREVFIVSCLQKKLLHYIKEQHIQTGAVFVTRNNKPMDRCNIWREMKILCKQADVSQIKVYPHNLRHLFARTFYDIEKDIAKLADILGHTNINTTRIYIISTGEEHRKRMENMHLIV